jgi:hypothetical protein
MREYTCHTCREPMSVSVQFHYYIVQHGHQRQTCMSCGAIHELSSTDVRLDVPGTQYARLSMEYPFPEHKPYRAGLYRVRFASRQWARAYWEWTGETFRNGPMTLASGSIISWQGLGGDMEHLKRMPYEHVQPITGSIDECD